MNDHADGNRFACTIFNLNTPHDHPWKVAYASREELDIHLKVHGNQENRPCVGLPILELDQTKGLDTYKFLPYPFTDLSVEEVEETENNINVKYREIAAHLRKPDSDPTLCKAWLEHYQLRGVAIWNNERRKFELAE